MHPGSHTGVAAGHAEFESTLKIDKQDGFRFSGTKSSAKTTEKISGVIGSDNKSLYMVDDQGILCPWAMDKINLKVEGAATFMGIANGDSMGHDSFTDDSHTLFYGKAVAVLRSIPGQSGEAKLIVTTEDGAAYERTVMFQ